MKEPTRRAGEFDANTLRLWAQQIDAVMQRCTTSRLLDVARHLSVAAAALRAHARNLEDFKQ